MIEFSTCYSCGSGSGTQRSRDLDTFSNFSTLSGSSSVTKVNMGHTRCFGSQFPGRSGRSLKCACLLTFLLAFFIGIGIGVLIPYYLMPVTVESLSYQTVGEDYRSKSYEHLALTPQPVIMNKYNSSSNSVNVSSSDLNSKQVRHESHYKPHHAADEFPTTDESVSNRFPEFAQIQALRAEEEESRVVENPNLIAPRPFRRPSSNVKFVVPDSRILSLHPVQAELPPARFNLSRADSAERSEFIAKRKQGDLLDGIYWSEAVEKTLPKGFDDQDVSGWRKFATSAKITKIEEGCGRMQNRLLSLENSTQACCRYRHNFDQIQGEIFSFYLSQILGIRNLAPSALSVIQSNDKKWTGVQQQLSVAQWVDEKPVVFTKFIDNLSQAYIPVPFRDSSRRLHPIDLALSGNLVESLDINELAQWSDLIVFDYLTANLDRMVNNLYNLQWNPSMMEAPAHNLAKDTNSGLLVFLDNESGLLHGYRLLDKYEQYHRVMLDSLCVFRKSTAQAVKRLHREKNVGHLLKTMFTTFEPTLINYLPMIPDKSVKILNHRIDKVYDQISKCESLYMS